MTFIGIDLHTNCFTCCYIKEDGTKVIRKFELTNRSLEEFYKTLDQECYVIPEASTNSFAFFDRIQ